MELIFGLIVDFKDKSTRSKHNHKIIQMLCSAKERKTIKSDDSIDALDIDESNFEKNPANLILTNQSSGKGKRMKILFVCLLLFFSSNTIYKFQLLCVC